MKGDEFEGGFHSYTPQNATEIQNQIIQAKIKKSAVNWFNIIGRWDER